MLPPLVQSSWACRRVQARRAQWRGLVAIARELGATGLFAGLGARMVMVSVLTASQFAVYGDLKRLLGIETVH